jgi:hypothetical protein
MNKIDLIIDYLDNIGEVTFAHQGWAGVERLNKALAAARELRELKPVAWIENHKAGQNISWSQDDLPYAKATPLYALDEVTK